MGVGPRMGEVVPGDALGLGRSGAHSEEIFGSFRARLSSFE